MEDTTKEERIALANKALAISLSGAEPPTKETLELVNQYIEGNINLEQLQQTVINKYTHPEGANQNE
jgi:hypothetical protein